MTPSKDTVIPDDPATKEELMALVARMRAVSDATYSLFFRAGMGSEAHAFLEFNGLISKYVDICDRCAEAGIDFRFLNTHSGEALPVEVHDMRYLGEKLDCILGPAIRANPAAREALRKILFGDGDGNEEALKAERAAHARTRAERDGLLHLEATVRHWVNDPSAEPGTWSRMSRTCWKR